MWSSVVVDNLFSHVTGRPNQEKGLHKVTKSIYANEEISYLTNAFLYAGRDIHATVYWQGH